MALWLLLSELYLVAIAALGLVVADLAVSAVAPSYLRDRAEAVALAEEAKRSRRPRPSLIARMEETQRRLRRAALTRFAVLTPVYAALGIAALLQSWPVPLSCCIPGISIEAGKGCISGSSMIVALGFLSFLPLVQEEAVFLLKEWLRARKNKL